MSSEMKYVTVRSDKSGEQLFIFPKNIDHNRFAEVLNNIKHGEANNWTRIYHEVISAGFTDGVKCYGGSETLGVKSRPFDTELLKIGGAA